MVKAVFLLTLILLLTFVFILSVSAIEITEVEINPMGGSSGKEWVELYNDDENDSDISGWEIWEGVSGISGPKKILAIENGTIILKNNFYIIELSSAKLNNGGDFVILYDFNGSKIDETETLKETTSGTGTWQLCNGKWEFLEATKNSENNCPNPATTQENSSSTQEVTEEEITEEQTDEKPEAIVNVKSESDINDSVLKKTGLQIINLSSKDIKTEENNENSGKNNYAIYGFFTFSILLGVLFLIKIRKYKNEFR